MHPVYKRFSSLSNLVYGTKDMIENRIWKVYQLFGKIYMHFKKGFKNSIEIDKKNP